MSKKKILLLIILGVIILTIGLILCLNNTTKSKIQVLDTTYNCEEMIENFYEDDEYIYSFSCIKSNYVYVKFENGDKILVKEALNDKLVTIKELEKAGLEFIKTEK